MVNGIQKWMSVAIARNSLDDERSVGFDKWSDLSVRDAKQHLREGREGESTARTVYVYVMSRCTHPVCGLVLGIQHQVHL
jgi:hypothetical protein